MQVDESLVNAHLEAIPCLGTFSVGGFSGGDPEDLGRHSDGSLNTEVLGLSTLNEFGAN